VEYCYGWYGVWHYNFSTKRNFNHTDSINMFDWHSMMNHHTN
jgi:hypothetical protein